MTRGSGFARLVFALVVCGLSVGGCGGPLVMIPGGALSGKAAAAPANWRFTDDVDTIQIETRPEDPYSVNVWGTALDDHLMIACGDPESTWCDHLRSNPAARVRVGDSIYSGTARLVTDPDIRERALVAMKKKYDFEPSREEKEQALLFEFRSN